MFILIYTKFTISIKLSGLEIYSPTQKTSGFRRRMNAMNARRRITPAKPRLLRRAKREEEEGAAELLPRGIPSQRNPGSSTLLRSCEAAK
jgi:hypothetical protein